MLASIFRSDETQLLLHVLAEPRWSDYAKRFAKFDTAVKNQDRETLDTEIPDALARSVLLGSKRMYMVDKDTLRKLQFGALREPKAAALSMIQVFDLYGGEALEDIEEIGSYSIPRSQ